VAMNCNSCGADSQPQENQNSWVCEYCNATNFDKAFLNTKINEKSSNDNPNLDFAIHSYESKNYDQAIVHLDKLINEDPANLKGHVMRSIVLAKVLSDSNYEKNLKLILSSLSYVEKKNPENEFLKIGKQDVFNHIAEFYINAVDEADQKMDKILYAYSSTSVAKASLKVMPELEKLGKYTDIFLKLENNVNNIKLKIQVFFNLKKVILKHNKNISSSESIDFSGSMDQIVSIMEKIKIEHSSIYNEIENIYNGVNKEIKNNLPKGESGCFIATATMGNHDHSTVLELRSFRDNYLQKRSWGRKFTNFYYQYGPYPASIIAKSSVLRLISYLTLIKPLTFIVKTFFKK